MKHFTLVRVRMLAEETDDMLTSVIDQSDLREMVALGYYLVARRTCWQVFFNAQLIGRLTRNK